MDSKIFVACFISYIISTVGYVFILRRKKSNLEIIPVFFLVIGFLLHTFSVIMKWQELSAPPFNSPLGIFSFIGWLLIAEYMFLESRTKSEGLISYILPIVVLLFGLGVLLELDRLSILSYSHFLFFELYFSSLLFSIASIIILLAAHCFYSSREKNEERITKAFKNELKKIKKLRGMALYTTYYLLCAALLFYIISLIEIKRIYFTGAVLLCVLALGILTALIFNKKIEEQSRGAVLLEVVSFFMLVGSFVILLIG